MAAVTSSTTIERVLPNGKTASITGYRSLHGNNLFCINYAGKAGYIDQKLFVGEKSKALAALLQQGVAVTSNSAWREIIDAIEELPEFAPALLIERPGWTGPYFTEKSGKVYRPKGQPKAIAIFKRPEGTKAARGTHRAWLTQVAEPLTGQNLPILAVLMALAAPLLEIIGEPQNMGFEFCGPPETGKTTCLRLMASIAGDPALIPNFNATQAGIESMFAEHNGLPFVVDEANLVSQGNNQFLKDFVFHMANGTTRLTAHRTSTLKARFIFATTANEPFHTGLREFAAATANAALQRLIPLQVSEDNPMGVFDRLSPGFATSGAMASHIGQVINEQYGTPMRKMLQALVKIRTVNPERLTTGLSHSVQSFEAIVGVAATTRGKSRVSTAIGLLYAAGEFAKEMGILPSGWDCMTACLAGYRNYQAQLPHLTPLAARLLAIAQRPETRDLRGSPLARLSDDEFRYHGAFLNEGVGGRTELLFTDEIRRKFFRDWKSLSGSREFVSCNLSYPGSRTTQRQVRQGRKNERFYTFVLADTALGAPK